MSGGYVTIPSSEQDINTNTVAMSVSPDRIIQQKIGRPSQKLVVALHTIFKLLALIIYMTASIISSSFIACFILVMMLLSADFWVVKNVSGRLLAGLRWWSVVDEEGAVVWRYESWTQEQRDLAQRGEGTYFWSSLITQQVLWTLLALVSIFSLSLKWLILCCLALSLNGSNLAGYTRARLGTRESVSKQFSQWFLTSVLRRHRAETAERTEIIK